MDDPEIKYLFEPRGIAVVGASRDRSKIGYKILNNIIVGGYGGRVYPVNPAGGTLLGLPVYKDINDAEGEVDIACIAVPAKFVFDAVKACARKGVKFSLIISSGFSEIGNREEEKKIVSFAREHQMRVMGPNIFGLYSAASSLNATFGPSSIRAGRIAIITQSGALGIAMIGKTAVENIGLSVMASVGNKADLDESDLLEHLLRDDTTGMIMMYIEGLKNGGRFMEVLKKTTRQKPVVVVKAGRSRRGAMAAASHTGALAGSDEIFTYLLKQSHGIRAENLMEALEWSKFFSNVAPPIGENTVIVTNGGGIGVLATDACEKYGVKLYDDYEVLKETFSGMMPSFGSTKNPIDLTSEATSSDYDSAFKASLENNRIHSLAALYCETAGFDMERFSPVIEETYRTFKAAGKPIVFCLIGGEKTEDAIDTLRKRDVPIFADPYEAVSCTGTMYTYYHYRMEEDTGTVAVSIDLPAIEKLVGNVREETRQFLLPDEAEGIMKAIGVPVPKRGIARTLDEAVIRSEEIGYPVVMKIVSKDIVHKSDVGGVALNLNNRKEVVEAYEAVLYNSRKERPEARIEGVEISEMVQSGVELIVGARLDPSFGPIVMCGLGGIYVEVMKDVSFRALPLARREVIEMIKETKAHSILLGVRGERRKDLSSLVATIIKVGAVIQNCKSISDIEINPLVVHEKGVKAVDVRILLSS